MRTTTIATLTIFGILITGCTNTDDPQLAMCQAVAKQLTDNSVSSWDNIEQNDATGQRTIAINYGAANGTSGSIDCNFPKNKDGVLDTAPNAVVHNGQKVGTKILMSAGIKASTELLKGTAANTVARSKELANEATQMATEVADKARDAAIETTKSLQQKLDN